MRILRMPSVSAETGHRSHATIYNAINAGLFPRQVRIGRRSVGWPSNEIAAIVAAHVAGLSEAAIRDLVQVLHKRRVEYLADFTVVGTAVDTL